MSIMYLHFNKTLNKSFHCNPVTKIENYEIKEG